MDTDEVSKLFEESYYTPSNAGSYVGKSAFLRSIRGRAKSDKSIIPRAIKWLDGEDTYTLFKPARKHFTRNRVIVYKSGEQAQTDLVDMQDKSEHNDGHRYLLTCIDIFSKYAWITPLKDKRAQTVADAFEGIIKNSKYGFQNLQSDLGTEFHNKIFSRLMKKYDINHFSCFSEMKAQIVERFHRTMRIRMERYLYNHNTHRYIDVLQDLVDAYNNSFHRSIKMAPSNVSRDNEVKVFNNLFPGDTSKPDPDPKYKFNEGDNVRISRHRHVFSRGYEQQFTEEIFKIYKRIPRKPVVYRLKDYDGEIVQGTFYTEELSRVDISAKHLFRVESIIKTKVQKGKKYHYVRWRGWPDKYNSWVLSTQLKDI